MSELRFRRATVDDLAAIVAMLADDTLGASRESVDGPLPETYRDAFAAIDTDPNQLLVVAQRGEAIVGTMQLTTIPHLTYRGGRRAQIEAVRVASSERGAGLGREMIEWGIERARKSGCHLVQLTSDKRRPDALRFYERIGFEATHEGFKLHLESR